MELQVMLHIVEPLNIATLMTSLYLELTGVDQSGEVTIDSSGR